jgi:hypothetical protein
MFGPTEGRPIPFLVSPQRMSLAEIAKKREISGQAGGHPGNVGLCIL